MALTKIQASNIATGAVNTPGIEADIALLGFKVASNGSLSKYNLVDQIVDAFTDAADIDAAASTGAANSGAGYYYGSAVLQTYASLKGTANLTSAMLSASGVQSFQATLALDSNTTNYMFHTDSAAAGSWMQVDFGSGKAYSLRRMGLYIQSAANGIWKAQWSNDASAWTDWDSGGTFGGQPASGAWYYSGTPANVLGMTHRYWRAYKTSAAATGNFHTEFEFEAYDDNTLGNMTLVSNATTAQAVPTKGDIVMTYTNSVGTSTVNTDIKAYASRDNGATYTQMTLGSQGDTAGHTILTAHAVDISGQPSGTSMRYKIETLNQGASKSAHIQAVSLGWS